MKSFATRTLSMALLLTCALVLALPGLSGCSAQNEPAISDASNSDAVEASVSAASTGSDEQAGSDAPSSTPAVETSWPSVDAQQTTPTAAKRLKADIKPIVKASAMDIGTCVIDLESGNSSSINGGEQMVAASMIKLVIAACVLEHAEKGAIELKGAYTVKEDDIVGGTGSIGGRGAGAEVTYAELFDKMIAESDNTATNILIDAVGMDAVNDFAEDLELEATELNRLMMDEEAIAEGIENYTSANDVAAILQWAAMGKLVSAKASKRLMNALGKQVDDEGILAGLPEGTRFAHKTGSLANARHDGGVVDADRDFVVVVMCGGNGFSLDGALEAMQDIGRVAYRDIVDAK